MFRPDEDESASEDEAFEIVANELVPFGARKMRSKSVVPTEDAQCDLRSRPSRGMESDDDDDDDGQSDRSIEGVPHSSCPFERFSRHPSISCREPSPSEERLGMVRSWRSSSTFSDDSMYDTDEERRVPQLTSLSGNRCTFREGQNEANVIWYYNVFADLT
ncbi:hypothetical protein R1sor_020222 [Riccia sorocarpa]|uniref:Uncharacterized protein n=1 Tax=Riccia sorocarpa TaxID=122646 RepID=A0ABD3IIJ8_9MARC